MYQCRFINYNKCITPVGDVDNVGGYEHVGTEGISETSYMLLNLTVNLKLL